MFWKPFLISLLFLLQAESGVPPYLSIPWCTSLSFYVPQYFLVPIYVPVFLNSLSDLLAGMTFLILFLAQGPTHPKDSVCYMNT